MALSSKLAGKLKSEATRNVSGSVSKTSPIPTSTQSQVYSQATSNVSSSSEPSAAKPKPKQRIEAVRRKRDIRTRLSGEEGLADLTPGQRKFYKQANTEEARLERATARVERLWKNAKQETGLTGPMPKVKIVPADRLHNNRAYVAGETIYISSGDMNTLGNYVAPKRYLDQMKRTLLHEFAHVGQSRAQRYTRPEGQAERYSRQTAKKMKLGSRPTSLRHAGRYQSQARRSRAKDSRRDILYGQFEPDERTRRLAEARKRHGG